MRLLITYSGALGGAERVLLDFSDALDGESCLACPAGPLAEAAAARGLRVMPLRARALYLRGQRFRAAARLAAHADEVRELVNALGPELVVASGMRSALAVWLGRIPNRVPVVFDHHDFVPGTWIGALVRRAAASSALVVVPSGAVAADIDPGGRLGGRLAVVHPGVDAGAFSRADGVPGRPPEVLVLGTLAPWKRPDLALEALALVRARRPDLRLRLVGAPLGPAEERLIAPLRTRASRPDLSGAVEFVGPVTDPREELNRATCLLHCAPREPFGIVLLEALAAGRPVIAPDSAGPREIVNPSCGFLYPPGDPAGAASALLQVLDDPDRAAAMGASGRERAIRHFGAACTKARFAQLIGPLARPRRRSRTGAGGRLALVTVTHNSQAELERMLESVARHLPGARVVVVDCASEDGSVEIARRDRDRITVELLALDHNEGFGAATNRGLATVAEPVTALVNPDVELIDASLLELADEAGRPGAPERLLAPLVLWPDGSRQDTVHPAPVSLADLARTLIPPALAAGPLRPALVSLAPWRSRRPRRVGWAVGCALVARTDTLIRLGPFDERIFLFGEDLDLGLRARNAGIDTWFWPQGRVVHSGAHATTQAFGGEPFERLARARHDVVARRMGPARARIDDAAQAATFASRRLIKRALGAPAERERKQIEAVGAVRRAP